MTVNSSVMRKFTPLTAYAAVVDSVCFPTPERRQEVCAAIINFYTGYIFIRGLFCFVLGHPYG